LKPALRIRLRDGDECVQGQCPGCGTWSVLDEDQVRGRVSMDCVWCAYHETHDLRAELAAAIAELRNR